MFSGMYVWYLYNYSTAGVDWVMARGVVQKRKGSRQGEHEHACKSQPMRRHFSPRMPSPAPSQSRDRFQAQPGNLDICLCQVLFVIMKSIMS